MTAPTGKTDSRKSTERPWILLFIIPGLIGMMIVFGEGLGTAMAGLLGSLGFFINMNWKRRAAGWFWLVVVIVSAIDAALLLFVNWPTHLGRGGGKLELYLLCIGNSLLFAGVFFGVRKLAGAVPPLEPMTCRSCGKPVTKTTIRCPACGEWKPGPLPVWPLLAGMFLPVTIFGMATLVALGSTGSLEVALDDNQHSSDRENYAVGEEVTDSLNRSVARTIMREGHPECAKIVSILKRPGDLWLVRCEPEDGREAFPPLLYSVSPKSGHVTSCAHDPGQCG